VPSGPAARAGERGCGHHDPPDVAWTPPEDDAGDTVPWLDEPLPDVARPVPGTAWSNGWLADPSFVVNGSHADQS